MWGAINLEKVGLEGFDDPIGKTSYTMLTIESARFGVAVLETSAGRVASDAVVAGRMEALINGWGARLVPIDRLLPGEDLATISSAAIPWLQSRLADELDYIIVGDVEGKDAREIDMRGKKARGGHAGGKVRLIEVRKGDRLVSIVEQVGSKFSDIKATGEMAAKGALEKFADHVEAEMRKEVAAIFQLR